MSCRVLRTGDAKITQTYQQHYNKVVVQKAGWAIGTDIVKAPGQPEYITAHTKGKVIKTIDYMGGTNGQKDKEGMGYGNYVMILHTNNTVTLYAHLETVVVKQGDVVTAGQTIGMMGNTGNSFGAHLHWELRLYYSNPDVKDLHNLNKFYWINPEPYINADLPKVRNSLVIPSYVYQGVDYSPVFDVQYYLAKYPDIKKAFGTDTQAAFNHFCTNGMRERRLGNAYFNINIYMANYEDLRNAFGEDYPMYYKHYCTNGKKEKRNATTLIKPTLTPTSYKDYSASSGKTYKVRKSFADEKSSKGSFMSWLNAYSTWNANKSQGYHVYSNEGKQLD